VAAAEGNDRRSPVGVRAHQRVVDARDRRQLLEALAVGHEDRFGAAQRVRELRSMQAPDERTRHDEAPLGRAQIVERAAEAFDRAVGDRDGVRAGGRGDVDADGFHHKGEW
jgi:hypothetical protein